MDKNEYNIGMILKGEKIDEKDNKLEKTFENEKIKDNNKICQKKEEENNIKINKDNKDKNINNNKDIKDNDNKDIKDNTNSKEVLQEYKNCNNNNDTEISLYFESMDQKIKHTIIVNQMRVFIY